MHTPHPESQFNWQAFSTNRSNEKKVEHYYRLRFEAAEQRYNRMKGLTRAALEKVRCIERENQDLRSSKELVGLGLEPRVANCSLSVFLKVRDSIYNNKKMEEDNDNNNEAIKASMDALVAELGAVREDNARLVAHIRLLRSDNTRCIKLQEDADLHSLYLKAIAEAREFKPTIAKLRAQISAMEFDWTQAKQLRDELFDYDDKLREHRMVEDALCLRGGGGGTEGVKVFATSRRQMLEILVEDRNRNINGHYARHVVPLEQLRVEKDKEILDLRRQVRMYELQSGIPTVELRAIQVPDWVEQACAAETRCRSVISKCCVEEAKLEALKHAVEQYEDRASEWKTAHDQALGIIRKAEKMRAEYDGLVAKLREEDQRILAKKKELEKKMGNRNNAVDLHARFTRLRDISEETDEAEGEIAAKELALKRLRANIVAREKALHEEQKALEQLEVKMVGLASRKKQMMVMMDTTTTTGSDNDNVEKQGNRCSAMEEDGSCCGDDDEKLLSSGFSSVCV